MCGCVCVWVCVVVTAQQSRITSVYILCQSSQRIQGYRCFIALGGHMTGMCGQDNGQQIFKVSSHDLNVWCNL